MATRELFPARCRELLLGGQSWRGAGMGTGDLGERGSGRETPKVAQPSVREAEARMGEERTSRAAMDRRPRSKGPGQ